MVSRYKELLSQREGNDRFVDGEAQTIDHLQKAKEVQCTTSSTCSTEVQVGSTEYEHLHNHMLSATWHSHMAVVHGTSGSRPSSLLSLQLAATNAAQVQGIIH